MKRIIYCTGAAFAFANSALAQQLYDFESLQPGTSLVGQDGWGPGITGSGSPLVTSDNGSVAITGNFNSASRSSDSSFDFASEFDAQSVRIIFDVNYIGPFSNIAIGALFFDDANDSGLVNSGEEVVEFWITRALPIQPDPSLGFMSGDLLLASISSHVLNGDRIKMRADITQSGNELQVMLYLLNQSRGDVEWTLLGQDDSLALHSGKSLSDIDTIQVRFDSGASFIDNIVIERFPIIPTPCELADMNNDGDTTPADFSSWVGCFNLGLAFPGCDKADQNQDGVLSPADFSAWVANFVSCGG